MRRRPRRIPPDAWILIASLVGVGALHLTAHAIAPPLVALADAPAHEGARVALEARLLSLRSGTHGRALVLAQDGAKLTALAGPEPRDGPAPGDDVRLVGLVTRLQDGIGLSAERIEITQRAGERPLEPATLAAHPSDYDGARVLVRGEVRSGALVGRDARLALDGDAPPDPRGWWLVGGVFRYRASQADYALRADAWTRSS